MSSGIYDVEGGRKTFVDNVLTEEWIDSTNTYKNYVTGETRGYTAAERAVVISRITESSRLNDLTKRIEALERAVYGTPPAPTDTTGVKTFSQWGGIVPPNNLLLSTTGKVYRNVSGVPLTTSIDNMPGAASSWTHLWALTLDKPATPPPGPTASPWVAGKAYKVDDLVTFSGRKYKCIQAHTSQAGWTPTAVASLWSDIGVA